MGLIPSERTVPISVSGCGFAEETAGTGIILDDGRVLVSGHVVGQSDRIDVVVDGAPFAGSVVALDVENDLGLVELTAPDVPDQQGTLLYGQAVIGEEVVVSTSQAADVGVDMTTSIVEVRPIRIQEVLGSERHEREAFSLDLVSTDGDSGAGVWSTDGVLLGVIFGHTTDDPQRGFATASSVIENFVTNAAHQRWVCDSSRSRLSAEQ